MRFGLLLCCVVASVSFAAPTSVIKKNIDTIINQFDKHINIGIEVRDITTGQTVYARNANRYYVPASSLKLFADAAALIYLGPDFHFKTQLSTNATDIQSGRLMGDLFVEFSGAPDLTHEAIAGMIQQLKVLGIKSIAKKVVLVGANYTKEAYGPGWMIEDVQLGYGAPISPFFLDRNITTLRINPAPKLNKAALIDIDDKSGHIVVINQVETVKEPKFCELQYEMDKHNQLTVSGCVGLGTVAKEEEIAIFNPALYSMNVVKKLFSEERIPVLGGFSLGKRPPHAKTLTVNYSKALDELLKDTLKPSNNAYADSVFLKIGEQFYKGRATWKNASKAVKFIIQKYAGVNIKRAGIYDGSGLSRYNLVTPHQMAGLLTYLYQAFPISYEFISALPIAGRDGTLRRRFLVSEQLGKVRAKTGSMRGVVSLAGFLPSKNHHILAFSMLINGIPGNSTRSLYRYRVLEDKLCDYLLKTELTNKWSKHKKKKYPFLRKKSFAQHEKQQENAMVSLEWALRKGLKGEAVDIVKHTDFIELRAKYSKHDANLLKKISSILDKKNKWALIKSEKTSFINTLKRQFKSAHYVLQNQEALPQTHYTMNIYGLEAK